MLKCMSPIELKTTVLGQYVGNSEAEGDGKFGYLDDPSVPKGSITPTFATSVTYVRNEKWDGKLAGVTLLGYVTYSATLFWYNLTLNFPFCLNPQLNYQL